MHKRSREEVDAIVREIADAMSEGRWVSGPSGKQFAERYGVHRTRINELATMASRLIELGNDAQRQERKAATLGKLEVIAAQAQAKGRYHEAVKALDSYAEIAGLKRGGVDINVIVGSLAKSEQWQQMQRAIAGAAADMCGECRAKLMAAIERVATGPVVVEADGG